MGFYSTILPSTAQTVITVVLGPLSHWEMFVSANPQAPGTPGASASAERGASEPDTAEQQARAAAGADAQTFRTGNQRECEEQGTQGLLACVFSSGGGL